jgi:hypothetical protein
MSLNRMKPENTYVAPANEWPQPIVALVSALMWSEVTGRAVKEIPQEIISLMQRARKAHEAVTSARKFQRQGAHARGRTSRIRFSTDRGA